jgi:CRISPR-associated protein Cmr6
MAIALYQDTNHPKIIQAGEHGGNAGLFWGKFFDGFNPSFTDFADKETSKRGFLGKFTGNRGDNNAINAAALRQIDLTEALGGVWFVATNHDASPFVTGTGNSHPVENGFLWHHTLSTPYMQGSAVKGIMRSWLENELGYSVNEDDNHAELKRYFGSETKASSDNQAGNLIFFDAIPIAQPRLKVEIMTPHMGDYYSDKGKTAPADWHSPNPIPLLAVESISLLFCIAPRNGKIDANELAQLKTALQNALSNIGAGAKTQTGFGRLNFNDAETAKQKKRYDEAKKQATIASASPERQLILAALDVINNCPAPTLIAGQTNHTKLSDYFKQTEKWDESNLASFWQEVVSLWLTKAYPDKKKTKEQAKKLSEKYPWLKSPQS